MTVRDEQRAEFGVAVMDWAVPDTGERRRTPHLVKRIAWNFGKPDVPRWNSLCGAIVGHPVGESEALDLPRALPGPEGACLDCLAEFRSRWTRAVPDYREERQP